MGLSKYFSWIDQTNVSEQRWEVPRNFCLFSNWTNNCSAGVRGPNSDLPEAYLNVLSSQERGFRSFSLCNRIFENKLSCCALGHQDMQNLCISLPSWLSFRFGFVPKKQFLWKPVRPNVLPENQIKSSPTGLRRDNSVSNVLDSFICHFFYHHGNFKIPLTGPAPNTANSCQRKLCPKCWTNQTWWNSWNLLGPIFSPNNTDISYYPSFFPDQSEWEIPNVKTTIRKIAVNLMTKKHLSFANWVTTDLL